MECVPELRILVLIVPIINKKLSKKVKRSLSEVEMTLFNQTNVTSTPLSDHIFETPLWI